MFTINRSLFISFACALLLKPVLTLASSPLTTIAITQIVAHPSLDKVRAGVINELAKAGYQEGKTAHIVYENAQGNIALAAQIAQQLVAKQPAIIIAIATPSAQTVASAARHTDIPLVFASISDPLQAKLVSNLQHPGGNITGTRNVSPIAKQLALIKQMLPQLTSLGIVLNYSEANSVELLKTVTKLAAPLKITIKTAAAGSSAEVKTATASLAPKVQALLLLQDNTVAAALPTVLGVAQASQLPVFSGFIDAVKLGALAGIAPDEYLIGRQTGAIAVKILHGAKPAELAVEDPAAIQLAVNLKTAAQLHLTIDKAILKKAIKY